MTVITRVYLCVLQYCTVSARTFEEQRREHTSGRGAGAGVLGRRSPFTILVTSQTGPNKRQKEKAVNSAASAEMSPQGSVQFFRMETVCKKRQGFLFNLFFYSKRNWLRLRGI